MEILLNVVSTLMFISIRSNKTISLHVRSLKKEASSITLQLQLLRPPYDLLLCLVLHLGCSSRVSVQGAVLPHQQPPGPPSSPATTLTLNVSPELRCLAIRAVIRTC